jgi:hypothetical protein
VFIHPSDDEAPDREEAAVMAFVEANRRRLTRGKVHEIITLHGGGCAVTRGGRCSCDPGPEVKLAVDYRREQAERN